MLRVLGWVVVARVSSSILALPCAAAQPTSAEADPVSEAAALYDEGLDHYQAGAYEQALVSWNRAYVTLPSTPTTQALRAPLLLNIVAAHEQAYALGRNPEHLAECIRLVANRQAELRSLYPDVPEALSELARLDTRWDQLARAHAEALGRGERGTPLAVGVGLRYASEVESAPAQVQAVVPAAPTLADQVAADPEFGPRYAEGKTLTGAGVVLLAVGGGFVLTGGALLATGATGGWRSLSVGGGVVFGVGILTTFGGGGALGAGGRAKREAEAGYLARQRSIVAAPMWLPGGMGVGLGGRF